MAQYFGRIGIRPELVRDIIKGLRDIERNPPRTYDPAPRPMRVRKRTGDQQ